jgi:hypothetical protein
MMEVQRIAIERALRFLNAAGCKYCILEADGTKHGTLEIAAPNDTSRRASRFPRGAMLAHYMPYVKDLKAGDAPKHPMVGRWAGDRLVVQGDYAKEDDAAYVPEEVRESCANISAEVKDMLHAAFS